MNREKMLELADKLEAIPDRKFDMSTFYRDSKGEPASHSIVHLGIAGNPEKVLSECGTRACIAGWAVILLGDPKNFMRYSLEAEAQALLNLSANDAYKLFYGKWTAHRNLTVVTKAEAIAQLHESAEQGYVQERF